MGQWHPWSNLGLSGHKTLRNRRVWLMYMWKFAKFICLIITLCSFQQNMHVCFIVSSEWDALYVHVGEWWLVMKQTHGYAYAHILKNEISLQVSRSFKFYSLIPCPTTCAGALIWSSVSWLFPERLTSITSILIIASQTHMLSACNQRIKTMKIIKLILTTEPNK